MRTDEKWTLEQIKEHRQFLREVEAYPDDHPDWIEQDLQTQHQLLDALEKVIWRRRKQSQEINELQQGINELRQEENELRQSTHKLKKANFCLKIKIFLAKWFWKPFFLP